MSPGLCAAAAVMREREIQLNLISAAAAGMIFHGRLPEIGREKETTLVLPEEEKVRRSTQ